MSQTIIPQPDTTVGALTLSAVIYNANTLYNALSGLAYDMPKIAQMTQEEYDSLEVKDPNTLYIIIAEV